MQVKTHINWNAVIQPLPNHCLSLDINVLPVFNWQSLDVFAVQVQRHGLGFHTEGNLVPVAVKQVVNFRVLEHSSDSIFCQADSVVLHRLVLTVQADGHLTSQRQDNVTIGAEEYAQSSSSHDMEKFTFYYKLSKQIIKQIAQIFAF